MRAAGPFHGGEEQKQHGGCCIDGGVQQDRQQEAATSIIEDPCEDDRVRNDHDAERDEGDQDTEEVGSCPIVPWDE